LGRPPDHLHSGPGFPPPGRPPGIVAPSNYTSHHHHISTSSSFTKFHKLLCSYTKCCNDMSHSHYGSYLESLFSDRSNNSMPLLYIENCLNIPP
jgi:hypothetical protein